MPDRNPTSRKCTLISDRQRKARTTGGKSQTGKKARTTGGKIQTGNGKAIITRGESQAGRKRQEDQSDRQNEKLLLQTEEIT